MGLGIVQTQIQAFEVTRRAIGYKLYQISATLPNLPNDGSPIVFDPSRRARQGVQEAP